jgi:Zn-dependent peptidase ImmA (M78 family)
MSKHPSHRISKNRRLFQNPYAFLDGDGAYSASIPSALQEHILVDNALLTKTREYASELRQRRGERLYNDNSIERIARFLQGELWQRRDTLAPPGRQENPLALLEPEIALHALGYQFSLETTLGQFLVGGQTLEVAGVIDKNSRTVSISSQFHPSVRKFTAAHELAHAVLHDNTGLHRDRAIDGSVPSTRRNATEVEADKFATFFLMPRKLVTSRLKVRVGTNGVAMDEATAFALGRDSIDELRRLCPTRRALSRLISKSERFGSYRYLSLAEEFGVSTETMAIRLEELALIEG